jgi:CHAT domain-containing protein/cytochrome c-type biogenesis protein CcmH/NrfG
VAVNETEKHLSPDQISGLIDASTGVKNPGQQPELLDEARRHLTACAACQKLFSIHEKSDREIHRLAPEDPQAASDQCPIEITWVEVAAGVLSPETSEQMLRHAARCDHCGPLLREASEILREDPSADEDRLLSELRTARPEHQLEIAKKLAALVAAPAPDDRPSAGAKNRFTVGFWPVFACAVAAAAILVAIPFAWQQLRPLERTNRLLAQAYGERRTLEMRIEGAPHAPVQQRRGADAYESRMSRPASLLDAESSIAKKLKARPDDPLWLDAQGRADLLDGNYEAAIMALKKAKELDPASPNISIDLASAYIVRGDALSRVQDYGTAINYLGQVLAPDSGNPIALFNRAIALERMFCYRDAVADWRAYLSLDSSSEWAAEARARLAGLEDKLRRQGEQSNKAMENPSQFIASLSGGREDEIRHIDARSERYQELALEEWLPQAFPIKSTDPNSALVAREALSQLADLLKSRHHDPWLSDLLLETNRSESAPLAIGSLADAIRLNQSADRDKARQRGLDAAEQFRKAGILAGELRAKFEITYSLQLVHRNQDCYKAARELSAVQNDHSYAWLQIQGLLEAAVCADMNDKDSLRLAELARELAEKHHYSILKIRSVTLLANIAWSAGDSNAAWSYSTTALRCYWDGDFPEVRGYNVYTNIDFLAEESQEWFLQAAVLREAVDLTRTDSDAVLRAVARARFGQALTMSGDLDGADSSYHETQNLFDLAPPGSRKKNLQAEVEIGIANVQFRRGNAPGAVERLERMRSTVETIPNKDLALIFFQSLGVAQLADGKNAAAEQSLGSALELAEEGLQLASSERKRMEWSRKNAPTYRALVQLKLAGKKEEALAYWEWYKSASLRTGRQRRVLPDTPLTLVPPLPNPGELLAADTGIISYALFDKQTAVWVYGKEGIQGLLLDLPKTEVEFLARRFGERCADPESDLQTLRSEARSLYQKIFLPLEPLLENYQHLLVEFDGALGSVPFEVLLDDRDNYLGDRFSITSSAGVHYLEVSKTWLGLSKQSSALVVGDPTAPGWSSLPAAETEALSIAAFFEHATVLTKEKATYLAIARQLPHADVFHFAGHAFISSDASGPVLFNSDIFDVSKLEGLPLERNRLVVLSACRSAQGPTGMFDDRDSIARLFVASGVSNVIASRWIVDSTATAKLMETFYLRLLSGKSVAQALHEGMVELRGESGMAHPFYWASFTIFGRG